MVDAKHFDLGVEVMLETHSILMLEISQRAEHVIIAAKKAVKNDPQLMDEFCKLCADFEPLTTQQEKSVFKELLGKVANTTFPGKLRVFREQHTVRGSEGNEDKLVLHQKIQFVVTKEEGKR